MDNESRKRKKAIITDGFLHFRSSSWARTKDPLINSQML
jgi:hypothetical protein